MADVTTIIDDVMEYAPLIVFGAVGVLGLIGLSIAIKELKRIAT